MRPPGKGAPGGWERRPLFGGGFLGVPDLFPLLGFQYHLLSLLVGEIRCWWGDVCGGDVEDPVVRARCPLALGRGVRVIGVNVRSVWQKKDGFSWLQFRAIVFTSGLQVESTCFT